jgi:SP family sugar:H+ symporter-like MFS transporter
LIALLGTIYKGEIPAAAGTVTILATCVFIAGFATSWGPVPFVVASEIYPQDIRNKAMSLALAMNWLMNFGVSLLSPVIQDALGVGICFIWFSFCSIAGVFVFTLIPETKGKSLEEIQKSLKLL